jgi:NAD(P)-dependent dehydrogenase (short-subunit alcohol dehydrogenase family)
MKDGATAKRVAIVTGASSGIGQAVAMALLAQGWIVFGASRRDSGQIAADDFHYRPLDVTDDGAVRQLVDDVWRQTGRIDAVVSNAGYSLVGPVEETADEEILAQFDVNFIGAWRMARAVLPVMRRQRAGRIVHIGSIGGSVGLPYQAAYSASKFALAGLTEALSGELADSGVEVVLVEPGNVRTAIGQSRKQAVAMTPDSPYAARFQRALEVIERDEAGGWPVEAIAAVVLRAMTARQVPLVIRAGPWMERLAPLAKAILPSRWFEKLLIATYR